MRTTSKRPNTIFPMIAVVVLVAGTILTAVIAQFTTYVNSTIETNLHRAEIKLNDDIEHVKTYANIVSRFLVQDDEIVAALGSGDRWGLIYRVEELNEDLEIDVYIITDENGIVVLQSASRDFYGFDVSFQPTINAALSGEHVVSFERGAGLNIQVVSGSAVYSDDGSLLGVVFIGFNIGTELFVDALNRVAGAEFMLFVDDTPVVSTVIAEDGTRVLFDAPEQVEQFELLGRRAIGNYAPLTTIDGRVIGIMLIWEFLDESQDVINSFITMGILLTLFVLAISVIIIVHRTKRIDAAIKEREIQIEARDYLLRTINSMTAGFLRSEADRFEEDLYQSMGLVGEALSVDRVFVFKNYMEDGKLHCTQIHEWSENVPSQLENEVTAAFCYSDLAPELLNKFLNDQCLNGIVDDMSPEEQQILQPQGIVSILLVPVFIRGEFWGFVGLDDCKKRRIFTTNEEMAMRAASLGIVSALFRREQTLQIRSHEELEQQLIEASKAKSKFLAHMSHEIRTPLNGIIGFTDLALELSPDDKTRQYLDNIHESSTLLLAIVNDILDISKVEAGKMKLERVVFNLSEVLNHAYHALETKAEKNNLQYAVIANDMVLDKRLVGDPTRLLQVLMNLLSNAVKFTRQGYVNLKVECPSADNGMATLHFEIKDTGIGMTQEQLSRIMVPFVQADDSITRMFGGTGLGLPICNEILKLMGSEMKIKSTIGLGTEIRFTLQFPMAADEGAIAESLTDNNPTPIFEAEVLLCEDNVMNQQVMIEHLRRVGIKTVIANNGKEGLAQAQNRAETGGRMFDLIFMDINMPVMGGLEAAKAINELNLAVPIVAVTANVMTTDYELYKAAGMDKHLSKPFRSSELRECLLSLLKPMGYRVPNEARNEENQASLRSLFLKGNAESAQKINEAIATGNIEEAHRIAHTLKSNAALIGKSKLRDLAGIIEIELTNNENNTSPDRLKMLEDELAAVLKEFGTPPIAALTAEENPAEIIELLNTLEPLLKTRNADCLALLGRIKQIKTLAELADQIESFDLKDALDTLIVLKARYSVV